MASPLASLGLPPPPRYPALTTVAASVMLVNALLLALAFAGSHLARHWQSGDERRLTVQVPQPGLAVEGGGTRRDAVLALGGLACLTARLAGLTGWPDLLLPATLLAAPWLRLLADIPLGFWAGLLGLGLWLTLLAWTTARLGLRRWLRRQP